MTTGKEKDMLKNLKVEFAKMSPSPENLSDFLSIMGANANLRLIERSTAFETEDVFGYVGHGLLDSVLARSRIIDNTQFVKLSELKNGELAACLLNIVYPRGFNDESSEGLDLSLGLRENRDLFVKAAFAQHFISVKEGSVPVEAYDNIYHTFAFVNFEDRVIMFQDGLCYDSTGYFKKHVWSTNKDGKRTADFTHLLDVTSFNMRDGHIYAVVKDDKLVLSKQLSHLQQLYSEKFGKFENDKSMSAEDWADMSSLNATINDAEDFELSVEGEKSPQKQQQSADSSSVSFDERHEMFQQIEGLEKKLWTQLEKFDNAIIPGEDVRKAKITFYEQLTADSESSKPQEAPSATKKRGSAMRLRTPFKELIGNRTSGNVSDNITKTKSATPKQTKTKKRPMKWSSEPRPTSGVKDTPKRRRV